MARAYRMTSARRAAIRKAQLASARKRRGRRRRRIATGVGIASAGVLAVTLGASARYGTRRRARMSAANVVQTTISTSKELDLPRWSLEQSMVNLTADARRKRLKPRIDYGRAGKTAREVQFQIETQNRRQQRAAQKATKAATGKTGKGRVRANTAGITDKVKRNRPKFNDDRRADYSPNARRELYERDAERISARNKANYDRKKKMKALKNLFGKPVVGNIRVNSTSADWNEWFAQQGGKSG